MNSHHSLRTFQQGDDSPEGLLMMLQTKLAVHDIVTVALTLSVLRATSSLKKYFDLFTEDLGRLSTRRWW
jgi:hypothetical protein